MSNLVNMTSTSTESAVEVKNLENPAETVSTVKISKKAKFKLAKKQTVKTDAEIADATELRLDAYRPQLSLEKSIKDDSKRIKKRPREHYVSKYSSCIKKSALTTLQMCRTVYEAQIALNEYEFKKFCKEINQQDTSSTIRKFIAIGRAYPRLVKFADQLSSGWTTIYQITQIPADTFDQLIADKVPLSTLRGKTLAELIAKATPVERLTDEMPFNKATKTHVFAEAHVMRDLDILDVRAIEKALNEIETRLPIRFKISTEMIQATRKIRMQIYEAAKDAIIEDTRYTPETWDLGALANSVLPRSDVQDVNPKA